MSGVIVKINNIPSNISVTDITFNYIQDDVESSEKADHLKELAQSYDFSRYDALVIVGGDGTLNELINGILQRKQKKCGVDLNDKTAVLKPIDIPLAIIPTGKTKCYAVFGNFCRNSLVAYSVMMAAYGMFGVLVYYTDTNRWLRRARYIFVPLWFFLFKTLRTFDGEVTYEYWKDEKENEGIPNAIETASGTMTGTGKATLSCLLALSFRDGIFNGKPFGESSHPGEDFTVIVYRPTSRFAIIKHFFSLKGELRKFEIPGFVSLRNIKSMKVEVPNSETNLDLRVNLDGELFKLTHPEIYIKFKIRRREIEELGRYKRVKQNMLIKGGQPRQCSKEKGQKDKQRSINCCA